MSPAGAAGPAEATIVMTRLFDAPRALVWQAMTEPAHLAQWWGGPGFSNPVCELDLRPGGRWHQVMQRPDETRVNIDFVYLEVEPPVRLVWEDAARTCVTTITFEELGAQTRWRMVAQFTSVAERERAIGYGYRRVMDQSLDHLTHYLRRFQE